MRIKDIRCEQFAGLRDRDYEFTEGLNIIIGENESGKSTLVDLLYHMFFQNAEIDGRRDRDFKEKYFPKSTGAFQGDTIDGSVRFETAEGTYRLKKEWSGKLGSARLTLPDGTTIRDSRTINEVLAQVLGYGKGVYDELVFASQRRAQTVLRALLDKETSESMNDLAGSITKAVMETGGIDIEAMEASLDETVSSYEGRWDFAADMPEGGRRRGLENPWSKGVGKILEAYYKKESIAASQRKAEDAEKSVERINASIQDERQKKETEASLRERFSAVRSLIASQAANKKLLANARNELSEMQRVLEDWPEKQSRLEEAESLRKQLHMAQTRALYDKVRKLTDDAEDVNRQVNEIGAIRAEDVEAAGDLTKDIQKLETKLTGLNLTARVRQLGAEEVRITSSVSGEPITPEGEVLDITEAVDICVPGIVEIRLSPKGVDVPEIRAELEQKKASLAALFACYAVESADQLRDKQLKARELGNKLDALEESRTDALGDADWEELCTEAAKIPAGIGSEKEITRRISEFCGISIETFVGRVNGEIDGYSKKYGSIGGLAENVKAKKREIEELISKESNAEAIPEEFEAIEDADAYDAGLKKKIESYEASIESLRKNLSEAERKLEDKSAEEYAEEFQKAEAEFQNLKADHRRWKHIQEVFRRIRDMEKGNPLEDVENYFRDYLSLLSDGKIVLGTIDGDLASLISSGSSRLTADILSDGTKETITLAFRLAVLKHLFPEGGCVAVFDDPFTDMDPRRTEQACRLVQEFAENNQVIFASCDDKYKTLLDGNVIRVKR